MPNLFAIILMCLLAGIYPAHASEKPGSEQTESLSPEDLQVVAVMEILEMMDLVEEMDMVKDFNCLIEDDPNESQDD